MGHDRFDHKVDLTLDHKADDLRRVDVITGVERRRRWTAREKLTIVAESMADGAVVSEVARRHGISPQQLFGWRAKVRAEIGPPRI
jgi:transposase